MALAVNFRWKTPYIQAPQTDWDKNKTGENITAAATAIRAGLDRRYNRKRQEKIDQQNEEDRQRRIDEEDRKKSVYQNIADTIRGRKAERDKLVAEANDIKQQIAALKQQFGG